MKSQKERRDMLENVRKICFSLPEVVEHIDGFGHITLQIRGKSFVKLTERAGLSFKSDRENQEFLLQKEQFLSMLVNTEI